jgi:predicted RNase H-like nuclease
MPVRISSLTPHADARGASFRIDVPFAGVGECHLATIRPGAVRGNHFHTQRRELLAVLYTDRWTLLWDEGEGTPVQSRTFDGSGAVLLEADALCAHAVHNDGAAELQIFVLGDLRVEDTQRRELIAPASPRIAGIDGCKAGWLAVMRNGTQLETRICHSDAEMLALFAECAIVAIDIPIGLTESGPRLCDEQARKRLGPRASSVFPAPIRALLDARDYADASETSRRLQNKGISKQMWMIVPKIGEIDHLLQTRPVLRHRVFEVHPEVSFGAWNGGPLAHSKHTEEGLDARRRLAREHFGEIPPVPRGAKEDDLLDALAALWTAERIEANQHTELGDGRIDATGLPMRIVF